MTYKGKDTCSNIIGSGTVNKDHSWEGIGGWILDIYMHCLQRTNKTVENKDSPTVYNGDMPANQVELLIQARRK